MRKIILIALSIIAVSCVCRPLEPYDYSTDINIEVNIDAICNVTCDVYNDKIPIPEMQKDVMRVLFYHPNDDYLITEAFVSQKGTTADGREYIGGRISIVPGTYKILIYAFGTESTMIENYSSFNNSYAFTYPISQKILKTLSFKSNAEEEILYQPDHLLVARSFEETIPYHTGVYTIHAEASSIVESYYLQIKIDGLEYVQSASAVLSGMVSKTKLVTVEKDYANPSSIYIPLLESEVDGKDVICNVFNTFGRIPDSHNELVVTFDLLTIDGRKVTQSFDISDLFLSEACIKHHWLLIEESIKIDPPEKPIGGGGFDPAVEDWEEEHRDIEI